MDENKQNVITNLINSWFVCAGRWCLKSLMLWSSWSILVVSRLFHSYILSFIKISHLSPMFCNWKKEYGIWHWQWPRFSVLFMHKHFYFPFSGQSSSDVFCIHLENFLVLSIAGCFLWYHPISMNILRYFWRECVFFFFIAMSICISQDLVSFKLAWLS